MGLGFPFQGTICFRQENSYASGESGPTLRVSDKVYDIKIDYGNTFKALRGISEPSICGFISQPSDYTLHIEWVSQATTKSLASWCVTRKSNGDFQSLLFDVGVNTKNTTKTYYKIKGAKCKTFNIKGSSGNEIIYTADFSVSSVIVGTSPWLTYAKSAMGNSEFGYFNKAGMVVQKNTNANIASIVDNIDVTINNNCTDYWDAKSVYKQACIPGALDISGTVDISLDDGSTTFLGTNATNLYTELTNIILNQSLNTASAQDKWTFTTCRWDGFNVDVNTSNDIVKTGQKFIAKTVTLST